MANNDRSVGKPSPNKEFMRPRDVPVGHDAPNLNDQRKVRPHSTGTPKMGVRPTGGAQIEPKAPPDKLGGDYIAARDVPMKTMTETELAEWNPFARSQPDPGSQNIGILFDKISRLEAGLGRLSVKIEKLERGTTNTAQNMGDDTNVPWKPPQETPTPMGMSTGSGIGRGQPSSIGKQPAIHPWTHRGEMGQGELPNRKTQWDRRSGGALPPKRGQRRPTAGPDVGPNVGPESTLSMSSQDQILKASNPKFWTDARLAATTPFNKEQSVRKIKMSGAGVREAYPDINVEHDGEPFHQSRIGDKSWDAHLRKHTKSPTIPDSNREFMHARDVSVERVAEKAEQGIDEMLNRVLTKMGLDEDKYSAEAEHNNKQRTGGAGPYFDPEGDRPKEKSVFGPQKRQFDPTTQVETRIPRTRTRWI